MLNVWRQQPGTRLSSQNLVKHNVGDAGQLVAHTFFEATTIVEAVLKFWNGSSWISGKPVKVWNGASWTAKVLKIWNGTSWVTCT